MYLDFIYRAFVVLLATQSTNQFICLISMANIESQINKRATKAANLLA